ncbi:hypothetical protein HDU86_008000 [Geranomyces michiganensis]|nr:hypothetical protein HDU86_008000 [Geranomyces michiganensis]
MWTGEGPAVKPVSHLAAARLKIPVFPSLTTEGLDSVLEKDKLYQELVNQFMSAKTNDAVESFRKHIKNGRRQIKAPIEREIHKQIFQDLPSAVKEWSSVTTPGALAAITAAPRTADLPGLDASAAELGSSQPADDSIQSAVADPLASLFGYLEPLVRGMQELKRARTPDSDNNENATFRFLPLLGLVRQDLKEFGINELGGAQAGIPVGSEHFCHRDGGVSAGSCGENTVCGIRNHIQASGGRPGLRNDIMEQLCSELISASKRSRR